MDSKNIAYQAVVWNELVQVVIKYKLKKCTFSKINHIIS
jgi:hypothetical protein